MKRILLTSTALVAFAGAASAEVSFGGDAEIKWNSYTDLSYGVGLTLNASQELDNGLTASAAADIEISADDAIDTGAANVEFDEVVLKLSSDTATLSYGNVATAGQGTWSGVTNMNDADFDEKGDNSEDAVLRGDMTFGSTNVAVSMNDTSGNLDQMQLGVTTDLNGWTVGFAYQDDTNAAGEIMGLFAKGTMGGMDLHIAYSDMDNADTSLGVATTTTFGDVKVGVFYVMEDAEDDNYGVTADYTMGDTTFGAYFHGGGDEDHGVSMTHDFGNGMTMDAGWADADAGGRYAGVKYDLGGGASVLASYGEVADAGPNDYNDGATLKVSFAF